MTYYASAEVDTWRNRAELAQADSEVPGFALDAPAVRVEPVRTRDGGVDMAWVVDILRGRF